MNRSEPRTARGNWAVNLLVLVLAIVISALGGEAAVRALLPGTLLYPRYHAAATYGNVTLRRLRPKTEFWHTSQEGSWRFVTNEQGFRDTSDYDYAKPEGALRVVNLGDSHTLGFEVRQERTFSEVMEQVLNRERPAEVLNTGISGFGTAEELAFLENEGIRYQPDVVVLGFYANDFEDNLKSGLFRLKDGELVPGKTAHVPGVRILDAMNSVGLVRWLSENSYLFSLAANAAWDSAKRLLLSSSETRIHTEYALAVEELDGYKKLLATRLLERLHAFCRRHGIGLIIVAIPRPVLGEPMGFRSSVPGEMAEVFRANSDVFIEGTELVEAYRGLAEIHLPHGHHHISELVHLVLGLELAGAVARLAGAASAPTAAAGG